MRRRYEMCARFVYKYDERDLVPVREIFTHTSMCTAFGTPIACVRASIKCVDHRSQLEFPFGRLAAAQRANIPRAHANYYQINIRICILSEYARARALANAPLYACTCASRCRNASLRIAADSHSGAWSWSGQSRCVRALYILRKRAVSVPDWPACQRAHVKIYIESETANTLTHSWSVCVELFVSALIVRECVSAYIWQLAQDASAHT